MKMKTEFIILIFFSSPTPKKGDPIAICGIESGETKRTEKPLPEVVVVCGVCIFGDIERRRRSIAVRPF